MKKLTTSNQTEQTENSPCVSQKRPDCFMIAFAELATEKDPSKAVRTQVQNIDDSLTQADARVLAEKLMMIPVNDMLLIIEEQKRTSDRIVILSNLIDRVSSNYGYMGCPIYTMFLQIRLLFKLYFKDGKDNNNIQDLLDIIGLTPYD